MMKIRRAASVTTGVIALAATALLSPARALEQVQLGQWYTIHTVPLGTCPALDWHFVVDANRSINGYWARDAAKPAAILAGTLNADDSFQMTATEVEGNRQASVSGKFAARVVTISIDGAGTACDRQTFEIRWVRGFGKGGGPG
jgi:hypothetical protein